MIAQLSGFEIMRLVKELKALEGSFMQKAYSPWDGLLALRFNTKAGKKVLVHKVGEWLYVVDEAELGIDLGQASDEDGAEVTPLVRILRDHVPNAFLTGVSQLAFDRIIQLEFRKELPFFLVFEMFGAGNVILRREDIIVGAYRTESWRSRVIMGGKDYRPPPLRKDPRSMQMADLAVLLKASTADLVRTLATAANIGGTYAEEVCHRAGLDRSLKARDLDVDQVKAVQEAMASITAEVSDGTGGFIHSVDDQRAVASAIKLKKFGDGKVEPFPDLSHAIRACYPLDEVREASARKAGTGRTQALEARIERLKHQARQQEEALIRFQGEMDEASAKSEAIYINYKAVEEALEKVRAARDGTGWTAASKTFPELEVDPATSTIQLELPTPDGKKFKVGLDLRKDVNDNAREYYESIKVVRDKFKGAEAALVRTRSEIARLVRDMTRAEAEGAARTQKKKARKRRFWFESYRWFISKDGNIVLGGKDANSNRRLVKRHLTEGDRYIHADVHGAPSIVVKATDPSGRPLDISEGTLQEACHFAVCFSKAWSSMLGSGEAYWVKPEQVSTTAQSGEFVPRGGFMIRGKRNTIRNLDMRLAVGLVKIEGADMVMCAPVDSVQARTDRFFLLVPSKAKKTDVSKAIARDLDVPVEEVEAVLPPGGMDVVQSPGKPA
jgi:predicted ribosome quality control (RQC) complex YloA/Tae2 family protein